MEAYLPTVQPLNQAEWKSARKRAIASKDPHCVLCGKWIDVTLPMKDPITKEFNKLAVEIDHIVPLARGGRPYDQENLQLSHAGCNRKKGARMDSDYIGESVTNPFPISSNW